MSDNGSGNNGSSSYDDENKLAPVAERKLLAHVAITLVGSLEVNAEQLVDGTTTLNATLLEARDFGDVFLVAGTLGGDLSPGANARIQLTCRQVMSDWHASLIQSYMKKLEVEETTMLSQQEAKA